MSHYAASRPLRLWPGVLIVALQWIFVIVPGWFAPATMFQFLSAMYAPLVATVLFAGWWLFASRASRLDRLLALAACVAAGGVAMAAADKSITMLNLIFHMIPAVLTGWIAWLVVSGRLRWPVQRAGLLVVFMLVFGYFALVRFEGTYGDFAATYRFRFNPTAEELLLADIKAGKLKTAPASHADATPLTALAADWPSFRGPERDGIRTGVRIATDWDKQRPREVWRHRVGPGWSSFAVVGPRLFTQEQRGTDELVVCYERDSGAELWLHRDAVRFNEAIGGPGPRATPTFHDGKLYTLGATGVLNCLDAATGKKHWSRDIVKDSGATTPEWGFSSSPLVVHNIVTVFAGAPKKAVLGYDAASGKPAWSAGEGKLSYCSTQRAVIDGVEQLLIATGDGLSSLDPITGTVLWNYAWPFDGGSRIVQPTLIDGTDIFLGTGIGMGSKRLHVARNDAPTLPAPPPSGEKGRGEGWHIKEVWTTRKISPYFNDLVQHRDHLYGFDATFFTCINLKDGKSRWRARGYGNGQVLLLADQELLLVLTEQGEVALVEAKPESHNELSRFQAIEGKTWNHPVVAYDKLFVRNGEEAACFELPTRGGAAVTLLPKSVPAPAE